MKIAKCQLGSKSPAFIITEFSVNHNGSVETAIEAIRASKRAGADAAKLQTYTADTLTIQSNKEHLVDLFML